MISIGVGAAWKSITPYIGVGGAWKQITGYWIGVGGVWKSMAVLPMSLSVSPTSASGAGSFFPPTSRHSVTTNSVTLSVSGGSGAFSYTWSVAFNPIGSVDTDGTCAADSPTSATTTFTGQTCDGADAPGSDYYTASCTVTDTTTGQMASISVPIALTNNYINPN